MSATDAERQATYHERHRPEINARQRAAYRRNKANGTLPPSQQSKGGVSGTLAASESLDSVKSAAPKLREKYLRALLARDTAVWHRRVKACEHLTGSDESILGAGRAGMTERIAKPPEPLRMPRSPKHHANQVAAVRAALAKRRTAPAKVKRPKLTREERNLRRRLKKAADRAAGIPAPRRTEEQNAARRLARKLARALPGPVPGSTRPGIALRPLLATKASARRAPRFRSAG